ncbi:MAG: hypothetical protein P8Y54_02200 [Xanthomonadales bacterium]
MNDQPRGPREQLLRDVFILQLKLIADGFRDALLIPISLVAAVLGLVRGGDGCDVEFRRVIDLGKRSERWINLFGEQEPLTPDSPVGSIDRVLEQVESVVVEQRRKGKSAAEIRDAIRAALQRETDGAHSTSAGRRDVAPPDDPAQ